MIQFFCGSISTYSPKSKRTHIENELPDLLSSRRHRHAGVQYDGMNGRGPRRTPSPSHTWLVRASAVLLFWDRELGLDRERARECARAYAFVCHRCGGEDEARTHRNDC